MATGLTLVSLADGKNFWDQGGACKTNILQAKSLQLLKVRTKTVRVWDFPKETIVIECGECKRFGRYSKARFVELYGGSTQLPDALDHLNAPRIPRPLGRGGSGASFRCCFTYSAMTDSGAPPHEPAK